MVQTACVPIMCTLSLSACTRSRVGLLLVHIQTSQLLESPLLESPLLESPLLESPLLESPLRLRIDPHPLYGIR